MNELMKKISKEIHDPSMSRRVQLRKQINSARMEMEYKLISIESWENELANLEARWLNQQQMKLAFDEMHQSDLSSKSKAS